jgi:hypothetical protein
MDLHNPRLTVTMTGPGREKWLEAYAYKFNALKEDTFELVAVMHTLPEGVSLNKRKQPPKFFFVSLR